MESFDGNGGSRRQVVTELTHIKELVSQLEVNLGASPALCKHLTAQIFSLTERSIAIVTSSNLDAGRKRAAADVDGDTAAPNPLSDVVDMPFKNTKKRRTMATRKNQVRVSSAVDDGHSWRKYGQKEILGTKHPRSYYRCTHRHSTGCPATKQVQRADDDSTLFDVIYLGEHTCVQKAVAAAAVMTAAQAKPPPEHSRKAHGLRQSRGANLAVETEGLAMVPEPHGRSAATPFCFPSTPASVCLAPGHSTFSTPETPENWGVSPASSGSNQFVSFPPFGATAGDAECRARSEFQEVVSALVAASSAPEAAVETDFADEFFNLDQSVLSYFADP
ncbi:hypothetical protein ACP70R_006667 [Stipagrostis hirtigluma subsp. patula]